LAGWAGRRVWRLEGLGEMRVWRRFEEMRIRESQTEIVSKPENHTWGI